MSELLICAIDHVSSDFYDNCGLPKVGDVIFIAEDGHPWSKAELTLPDWRIICLPGVPESSLSPLVAPEKSLTIPPAPMSKTLQYRSCYLNSGLVVIETVLSSYLNDSSRASAKYTLQDGVGSLQSAISQRPPIADPNLTT